MQPLTTLLVLLAASASADIIKIEVGESTIKFDPDSTTAKIGDTLQFHFYPGVGPHSVVSTEFNNPCLPGANAFFSGYLQGTDDGSEVFEYKVTTLDPIWYYCSAKKHCQNGMVGVINPPSNSTITDFANKAKGIPAASAPAAPIGGTTTSIASGAATSSGSAASSTGSAASSAASVTSSVASSVSSAVASVSSKASSVASSAAAAATSAKPAAAGKNDAKAVGALAAVAGGLVALLA